MRDTNGPLPDTPFWHAYNGRFAGIPTWDGFDRFWQVFAASGGDWYVFDPSGEAPAGPETDLAEVLAEAHACVDQVRRMRSYCGAVFADDLANPGFVKVFDPWKMGGVCGGSGERVMPRWIFSRIAPDALPLLPDEPEKKGLFARIIG
ncbi:hypothetical protein [Sinisalibacter aestuarii]|uniref:Uncharacterized protein n=1 Tax=Sinisalibacter aestuarii TaxID=2949426 RepID=A0ABQ5LP28_9RHOB|nr:hypothetical protein [Sinisalibacter aestuarii]GKY86723.1 hypothetical protein STA1M1_05920 [Sinisalibacter aestuarii]